MAQSDGGQSGTDQGAVNAAKDGAKNLPCPTCVSGVDSVEGLLEKIINYGTVIAVPILSALVLYGGFQMLFARDNETKYKEGIKTIKYAAIGFIVILLANGVGFIIKDFLGVGAK